MATNPNAIFSKTGKGVQEAAGKTSLLGRGERAVLQQIDGKANFAELQQKFEKTPPVKLDAQIQQLERDGFIREVPTSAPRPAPIPAPAPAAPIAKPAEEPKGEEELDFTRLGTPSRKPQTPPAKPVIDLAAKARAEADRQASETAEFDFRKREEAMARARAETEAKTRAEFEEKIKAAREAAVRAAAEAKLRAEAEAMAKIEAAEKARQEAEELRRQLEEQKARHETGREEAERQRAAQEQARKEAEEKARREAEELRRELEEHRARAEAERRAREESERRGKQDAERLAREAAERAVREEAERQRSAQEQARKEAEEKARLEAAALQRQLEEERRAREETERRVREETERRTREETERRAREEAERQSRDAAEREAREKAERERAAQEQARKEAEEKARLESAALQQQLGEERRAREETERRAREETERRAREEIERQARDAAERAAREEVERERAAQEQARREAEEKARLEAAALQRQLAEERSAREASERRAREEAERARIAQEQARKQAEEKSRREAAEGAAREESDRQRAVQEQARREAEAKARREAEDLRRQLGEERARADAERRTREDAERQARERTERVQGESEQRAKDEADRKAREDAEREASRVADEERARGGKDSTPGGADDEENRKRAARALVSKAKSASSIDESLMADLDSFAKQDDEARQAQEAEARAAKERTERAAREQSERAAQEASARAAKDASERAAKELAERAAKAVSDRSERQAAVGDAAARDSAPAQGGRAASVEDARREAEEERRRAREKLARRSVKAAGRAAEAESDQARLEQEAERRRKAREAVAGTVLEKVIDEDLEIDDDELGFEEIERERMLFEQAAGRRERKSMPMPQERQPPPDSEPAQEAPQRRVISSVSSRAQADDVIGTESHPEREPVAWAKYGVIGLIVLLVAGIGGVHVVPFSTADYEKAASEALGVQVRIGSARLSLITGIQMKFERVTIGDTVQVALARAHGGIGGLTGDRKSFDRVDLEGASIPQEMLGDALFGALKGANLKIARVTAKQLKLPGPVTLPELGLDLTVGGNGAPQSILLTGADGLQIKLIPGSGGLSLEGSAASFPVPILPGLSFADFAVKGSVTRQELSISEFDGRLYEGVVSGSARVRWGAAWSVEGEVRAKNLNAAVFAPALLSEGRGEGRALYSMAAATPAKLGEDAKLEGNFKIDKGVLGSFDLGRAIQTNGAQSSGRTLFSELAAQFAYQAGAAQLRNITIAAGPLNAGASLDIANGGALTGRIVADLKTPAQTMRATLSIGGKAQDPVLRR